LATALLLSGCGEDLRPKLASLETKAQILEERAKHLDDRAVKSERETIRVTAKLESEREAYATERNRLQRDLSDSARKLGRLELEMEELRGKISWFEEERRKQELALKAEADSRSSGTVQVGVVMKSGDTKPAANIKVYLLRSKFDDVSGIGRIVDINGHWGVTAAGLWAGNPEGANKNQLGQLTAELSGLRISLTQLLSEISAQPFATNNQNYQRLVFQRQILELEAKIKVTDLSIVERVNEMSARSTPEIERTLEENSVATATTNFNGVATFEGVPKGAYWVVCRTSLGGGAVLHKDLLIKTGKFQASLSNSDVVENFK
jgi:chromosome segregation ATPase